MSERRRPAGLAPGSPGCTAPAARALRGRSPQPRAPLGAGAGAPRGSAPRSGRGTRVGLVGGLDSGSVRTLLRLKVRGRAPAVSACQAAPGPRPRPGEAAGGRRGARCPPRQNSSPYSPLPLFLPRGTGCPPPRPARGGGAGTVAESRSSRGRSSGPGAQGVIPLRLSPARTKPLPDGAWRAPGCRVGAVWWVPGGEPLGVLALARERMRPEGREAGGRAGQLGEAPIRIGERVTFCRADHTAPSASHPVPCRRRAAWAGGSAPGRAGLRGGLPDGGCARGRYLAQMLLPVQVWGCS